MLFRSARKYPRARRSTSTITRFAISASHEWNISSCTCRTRQARAMQAAQIKRSARLHHAGNSLRGVLLADSTSACVDGAFQLPIAGPPEKQQESSRPVACFSPNRRDDAHWIECAPLHPEEWKMAKLIGQRSSFTDRKSTRLNSSHEIPSRMPSSA